MDNPLLQTKFWTERRIISLIASSMLVFMLLNENFNGLGNNSYNWLIVIDKVLTLFVFAAALIPLVEPFISFVDEAISSRILKIIILGMFWVVSIIQLFLRLKDLDDLLYKLAKGGLFMFYFRYLLIRLTLGTIAYWNDIFPETL